VETYDAISKTRFASTYSYKHGFYDTVEREFRGFGRVDQKDTDLFDAHLGAGVMPEVTVNEETNEFAQAPVLRKTWFHTGAWSSRDREALEAAYAKEWWDGDGDAADPPRCVIDATTPEEAREATRALRGTPLRKEVYGLDGSEEEDKPYA